MTLYGLVDVAMLGQCPWHCQIKHSRKVPRELSGLDYLSWDCLGWV